MRDWVSLLILAPTSMDLNAWSADSTQGAALQTRDVLAGPPAYRLEDWSDPDGLGDWVQPTEWIQGTSTPPPALAIAVSRYFGKRPGVQGRLGARIYHAQVSDWLNQAESVAAGVVLAAGEEGDDWPPPYVVVLLREEDANLTLILWEMLPGIPVRYVPYGIVPDEQYPAAIAAAIADGLAELGV